MNHTCVACPLGASCKGFTTWSDVKPKYGWWRLEENSTNHPPTCLSQFTTTNPPCAFEKCLYPHACFGAADPEKYYNENGTDMAEFNRPEICDEANGYKNNCTDRNYITNELTPTRCRLCATCKEGYKRSGSGTQCKKCPPQGTNQLLLGVGFVVMCLGSTILVYMQITSEAKDGETSDAIKKIGINFLQMISLAGGLPLKWPQAVETMMDTFSTLSSAGTTLLIPDCELTTMRTSDAYFMKQIAYVFIMPGIIVVCIFIWSIIAFCCCKIIKIKNRLLIRDYTILSIVLLLFLAYPMLTKLTLSMFKCPKLGGPSGSAYLMADLQEQCFTGRHLKYMITVTVPQLLLVVFGLPISAAILIFRNKLNLKKKQFFTRYGLLRLLHRIGLRRRTVTLDGK